MKQGRSQKALIWVAISLASGISQFGFASTPSDQTTIGIQAMHPAVEQIMKTEACTQDIQSFCGDTLPGQGRVASCLRSHQKSLTSNCRQSLNTRFEEFKGMHQACKKDVLKFCGDIQPGGNRIMGCLKDHQDALSLECRLGTRRVSMGNR